MQPDTTSASEGCQGSFPYAETHFTGGELVRSSLSKVTVLDFCKSARDGVPCPIIVWQ